MTNCSTRRGRPTPPNLSPGPTRGACWAPGGPPRWRAERASECLTRFCGHRVLPRASKPVRERVTGRVRDAVVAHRRRTGRGRGPRPGQSALARHARGAYTRPVRYPGPVPRPAGETGWTVRGRAAAGLLDTDMRARPWIGRRTVPI